MKTPWDNKTGLLGATAFLATLLGISTGLCGLNFIAMLSIERVSKNFDPGSSVLVITAFAEFFVMILSTAGLLIVLLLAIIVWLRKRFSEPKQEETL